MHVKVGIYNKIFNNKLTLNFAQLCLKVLVWLDGLNVDTSYMKLWVLSWANACNYVNVHPNIHVNMFLKIHTTCGYHDG
jgi:hypothetical protein